MALPATVAIPLILDIALHLAFSGSVGLPLRALNKTRLTS